mgnify:CR=1 FL=1
MRSAMVALDVTAKVFELMGARATATHYGFDRYWRNVRTHTLHDPVRWKYHAVGNYVLNGIRPPRHGARMQPGAPLNGWVMGSLDG